LDEVRRTLATGIDPAEERRSNGTTPAGAVQLNTFEAIAREWFAKHSPTLRERIVEHVFVGEVLRTLWRRGVTDVEILRPEFDAHGYDVVMSRGPVVRHVQLKTQAAGKVSVGRALAEKPSGCVVWISLNKETLELGPFMWFGGAPGKPLPDIASYPNPRRATHNADGVRPVRKNHHVLPPAAFTKLKTLDEVVVRLFGELAAT
jgi:hypothetical protein